jgi:hypothetical protein
MKRCRHPAAKCYREIVIGNRVALICGECGAWRWAAIGKFKWHIDKVPRKGRPT